MFKVFEDLVQVISILVSWGAFFNDWGDAVFFGKLGVFLAEFI